MKVLQPWWDCMKSFQDLRFFYHQHPWEAYVQSYRTAEWKTKSQTMTDTIVVPRWEKEMRGGKKGLTISAFLYLGSLFVVCFVRVLLMLVFKMCSVSPVDAVGWENRSLLQRQNTTFVLEWVEESIRVPCEKFPERVTEEVCQICVLKHVRMLQHIQTSTRGVQTKEEEMYLEHPVLRTRSSPNSAPLSQESTSKNESGSWSFSEWMINVFLLCLGSWAETPHFRCLT